jgi:hypothetical protein
MKEQNMEGKKGSAMSSGLPRIRNVSFLMKQQNIVDRDATHTHFFVKDLDKM